MVKILGKICFAKMEDSSDGKVKKVKSLDENNREENA